MAVGDKITCRGDGVCGCGSVGGGGGGGLLLAFTLVGGDGQLGHEWESGFIGWSRIV